MYVDSTKEKQQKVKLLLGQHQYKAQREKPMSRDHVLFSLLRPFTFYFLEKIM